MGQYTPLRCTGCILPCYSAYSYLSQRVSELDLALMNNTVGKEAWGGGGGLVVYSPDCQYNFSLASWLGCTPWTPLTYISFVSELIFSVVHDVL